MAAPIVKLSLVHPVFTQGQLQKDLANGRAQRATFTFTRTTGGVDVHDGKQKFWVPDSNIAAVFFADEEKAKGAK
jgi:hypothetical protein